MNFVALDLSLRSTGAAWVDGPLVQTDTLRCDLVGCARLADVRNRVMEVVHNVEPTLVVIEGYAFARPNQAHQIGELGGVIRLALWEADQPYIEVAPKTVKKLATGKGGASKPEVLAEAVRRLGYLGASSDEADARWVLEAALQYYLHPSATPLPASHREGLGKVSWPTLREDDAA